MPTRVSQEALEASQGLRSQPGKFARISEQIGAQIPPWEPLGDLVTQSQVLTKNCKISRSIQQKVKRWTPKLERQHHFFCKSLKTEYFLMILRVREPRAGGIGSPALENARTP